ncbi:MAG: CshA/CshB family fibrillar adhesin-related protein [Pseudomonadota bacterium]
MADLARPLMLIIRLAASLLAAMLLAPTASAQSSTCGAATSQGTAPASWQTYCWIDMDGYDDALARSASGQTFAVGLSDGSILNFTLRTNSTASSGANARAAPSWSGAAVGNTAFLGIPGRPILYMANSGSTVTFDFSNISVTPPPGVATVTTYAFVVADAESTDNSEYLEYTTNGGTWQVLDAVPPISGSQMPGAVGAGTNTFRSDGLGQSGRVGAYIVGSNAPTNVTAEMNGAGLQGIMFAVRFASISLNKVIGGTRLDPSDQFDFAISSTSSGDVFATGATNGTGLGPFDAAVLTTASGIPLTISEQMATGSASAISSYNTDLTCTNGNAGSSTPLPSGVLTSSYNFGPLQFGDAVECRFTNTPLPHVIYRKEMGAGGRIFDTDQFRLRTRDLTTGINLVQIDTEGTGATLTVDGAGPVEVTAGNTIRLVEFARGSTVLSRYTPNTVCTNTNAGSTTTLPSGGRGVDLVPQLGDVITCVITNTRGPADAIIVVEKNSAIITNDIETSNFKAIPTAVIEYTISVRNEGDAAVDVDTLDMLDIVPPEMAYDTGFGVAFTEAATPSGLDPFDQAAMVSFSEQPGGVAPFTYGPSGAFDPNVSAISIEPTGQLAASDGTNHPGFTITYRMQVE